MTVFEFKRRVIAKAIEAGWPGEMPSVMGTYYADKATGEARDWLRERERERLKNVAVNPR